MIPESGLEGARTDVDDLKRRPLGGVMRPPRGRKKTPIELNGKFSSARLEGPYTRGKYAQSGPGTRSRCRSKSLTQISRRLRLLCALCREDPAEMAHPLAAAGSARPRSRVGAKPHVPPPRRRGDTYGSSVKNGAGVGCGKADGLGVKRARSTWSGPHVVVVAAAAAAAAAATTTAADPVQGLTDVDVNGKARPSSSELPEEDAVRSVATPVCGLRGACESALKVKKCGKKAPDTSGLVICIGQYPKVKLCDVSQRCDAYRRDRCYKLPEVLKTKSVRCFKRELEAGVRLKPISPRGSQCGFKKNDLAESNAQRDGMSSYQYRNRGDFENKGPTKCKTVETAWQRQTSKTAANCFTSFLPGKPLSSQELWSGTLKRDYKGGHAAEHDHRLWSTETSAGERFGSLISQQQTEDVIYSESSEMDTRGRRATKSMRSMGSESPLDSTIMCSHSEVLMKEKHPYSPAGRVEESGQDESSDSEPEGEEFSCQRARVYLKKLYLSCARTYMHWPFSDRGPKVSSGSDLAQLGNLSALGNPEAPVNGNNPTTANDEIKVKLSNVATDCAIGSVQLAPLPPKNGCSLDRTSKKLASTLSGSREPLPMSSKTATILSPMRQTGPNNVTRSWLRSGSETPSSLVSTPCSTPSLLSPSVDDRATSPLLISTPDNGGNFSAMPCSWPLAFANLNEEVPLSSSSCSSPRHEVGAIGNSAWHDKETTTDSSRCTHSSMSSRNSDSSYSCDSHIVTQEKNEAKADIFQITSTNAGPLIGVPVEQWSEIYMDLSLPWPPISPLSSPTRPSDANLQPNQSSQVESETCVEASLDSKTDVLDEITAYEHDILLVDMVEDDPDLFGNLPKQSMLKLGPPKSARPPKIPTVGLLSKAGRALLEAKKSVKCSTSSLLADSIEEESESRPWRAKCHVTPSPTPSTSWPPTRQNKLDTNNNNQTGDTSDRPMTIQDIQPKFKSFGTKDLDNGQKLKIREDVGAIKRYPFKSYCRFYFSEKMCKFNTCRFQHVPVEGDEKFCMEMVQRFSKNQLCLQKASAVFTDYYQNNSPGVFFSNNVVTCLLLALLKAGLFMDVLSVLNVSLTHKIMPVPEVMLELFNVVQVKDLTAIAPELTRLTSQMSILGLPSVDGAQMTPDFHGNSPLANPVNHMLLPPPTTTTTSNGFSESLNLAHAVVEVELCTKHKNWPRLGLVLKLMCQSNLLPGDLEQLGGRIAVALLTEINNKQPIPFATFTDTVCQERGDDLVKTTLGRIGVSLMLRYHRTHQWAKGRQVVEILSGVQVAFSTLKGFFGNENAVSRCSLITMATELFVLSGSIEGALSTLRANEWFLASCSWPCEPRDLEKRTHVLMRLAESTSHRDTLEIFSKLPGIKEPHESIDISQYGAVFNAHLQTCVERWMLPVASDLVELMLCKQLAAEAGLLQTLFNKLGQQNLWLRARGIFKRALNAGYYPVVALPPDLQSLCVPSSLGGMEMALCLEMFVTANLTSVLNEADTTLSTSSLCITLQRSNTCEGEYLSASSRLLSAAAVLQPKLTLHFTAVNPSQEQVFTLDMPSVRLWLQHNRSQANEVWSDLS